MSVEVRPHGEHGRKKWCVYRDDKLITVCDTNSQACEEAARLAKAYEDGQAAGKKQGIVEGKKFSPSPESVPGRTSEPPKVSLTGFSITSKKQVKKTKSKKGSGK